MLGKARMISIIRIAGPESERQTKAKYAEEVEVPLPSINVPISLASGKIHMLTLSSCTLPSLDMSFLSTSVPFHFFATVASESSYSSSLPASAARTCFATVFGPSTGSLEEGANVGISARDPTSNRSKQQERRKEAKLSKT